MREARDGDGNAIDDPDRIRGGPKLVGRELIESRLIPTFLVPSYTIGR